MDSVGNGGSAEMVTVPVPSAMIASTAPDRTTVKLSAPSRVAGVKGLAMIPMEMVAVFWPAANVTVPVAALKSVPAPAEPPCVA